MALRCVIFLHFLLCRIVVHSDRPSEQAAIIIPVKHQVYLQRHDEYIFLLSYVGTIWSQYKGDHYLQNLRCTCFSHTLKAVHSDGILPASFQYYWPSFNTFW